MRGSARGFSLAEMAVVLAIVGLLLGGLLLPLGTQIEQRNAADTQRLLEAAREALIGFAIVNGRLPCPATAAAGTGDEAPVPPALPTAYAGICTDYYTGFLPARAIGFQPTDSSGYALDAWGNRIRYAASATTWGTGARFTKAHVANDASASWSVSTVPGDLAVMSNPPTPPPLTLGTCASTAVANAGTVVAIVFSTGKNGALTTGANSASAGPNEARNSDGDALFVSSTPEPSSSVCGEFDDNLVWLSTGVLYGRMISAGVLP